MEAAVALIEVQASRNQYSTLRCVSFSRQIRFANQISNWIDAGWRNL